MVCVLLGTGFEETEALVPVDLLRRAGIPVTLAGLTGREVTGSHQITVKADKLLSEVKPEEIEMVFLPGGSGGVASISACPPALELIRTLYDMGRYVAAICAAPTVLAALGLLEGRPAVCYPGMEAQLSGAVVRKGTPVVPDGQIITGEAAGSAFAFGLKLIEVLKGSTVADSVKNQVFYHGETYGNKRDKIPYRLCPHSIRHEIMKMI